ncbi:hypothetical protein GGF44_005226 [Coemansia sp. RSA 1694]|nr:hypothetical protein GGF44_005226 [Coemansia sp. RSA 1694]
MPTSHQKLQSVGISFFDDLTPDVFATAADCLRFVLNIGSRASVREFRGYMEEDKFIPALSTLGDYACIQVLVLSNMRLDLWQTIALVKLLPLLSDLTAASPNPCPLPDGIMRDELPAYVVSTYAPLGVRFRCWHFIYESGGTDCYGMESVFLLALACPNFTFMTQKGWSHEFLVEEAKPVIALDMFKEYTPRLQCFLGR